MPSTDWLFVSADPDDRADSKHGLSGGGTALSRSSVRTEHRAHRRRDRNASSTPSATHKTDANLDAVDVDDSCLPLGIPLDRLRHICRFAIVVDLRAGRSVWSDVHVRLSDKQNKLCCEWWLFPRASPVSALRWSCSPATTRTR